MENRNEYPSSNENTHQDYPLAADSTGCGDPDWTRWEIQRRNVDEDEKKTDTEIFSIH